MILSWWINGNFQSGLEEFCHYAVLYPALEHCFWKWICLARKLRNEDFSSSSDVSGACSTEGDDVQRNMDENGLVLPPLPLTLVVCSGPSHYIVNVWQSVPCTVWQQVSPAWPSIRLSRNGLAVGTHAQPSWAPARPGCSMDQPVRPLLQKVRHCMKKWKMYLLIFLITGSPWQHQLTRVCEY